MTKLQEHIIIKKDKGELFDLLKDMRSFPNFMKYVNSLKVTKQSPIKFVSEWSITIDGVPVRWKEEDTVNENAFTIDFKMIDGDYSKYSGRWEILQESGGYKVKITTEIDWGAPAFTSFNEVKKILLRKTRKAFKGMLLAIKRKAER